MELNILYFLQSIHNAILDQIMVGITYTGNVGVIWILLATVFIISKKYRLCGITILISILLANLLGNIILKNIFLRPRPSWVDTSVLLLIKNPSDYSFPSGHTLTSFASAMTVLFYHKKEGIAALIWAGLIGFSRLYLFVHYPTDVITSILLGIGIAAFTTLLVRKQVKLVFDKEVEK